MSLLRFLWKRADEPLGRRGERAAARFLRKAGYRILQHNAKRGDDEADLIAIDPDRRTLVIIEVKTRSAENPAPEIRINQAKMFRLARFAANLQQDQRFARLAIRFDVIAIVWPPNHKPAIKHHVAAFDSPF